MIRSQDWNFQGPKETFLGEHLEDKYWARLKIRDELEMLQHYFPRMNNSARKVLAMALRELDFAHRVIVKWGEDGLEANRKSAGSPSGTAEHPEDYAKRNPIGTAPR